jgi:hypothetical protein
MAIVNITVDNDADFYQLFQYVMATSQTPIDMTGASLEMMLRRNAEDNTALLRLATDTGDFVLTDPVNGYFTLMIRQTVLENLEGSYDHSNIMTLGGLKTRIWGGTIQVNPGPTR